MFFTKWSAKDRELARSLILHERSLCSGCGHPAHETRDPDREGWYLVDTVVCAACRAIEMAADGNRDPGARHRARLDPDYRPRNAGAPPAATDPSPV